MFHCYFFHFSKNISNCGNGHWQPSETDANEEVSNISSDEQGSDAASERTETETVHEAEADDSKSVQSSRLETMFLNHLELYLKFYFCFKLKDNKFIPSKWLLSHVSLKSMHSLVSERSSMLAPSKTTPVRSLASSRPTPARDAPSRAGSVASTVRERQWSFYSITIYKNALNLNWIIGEKHGQSVLADEDGQVHRQGDHHT